MPVMRNAGSPRWEVWPCAPGALPPLGLGEAYSAMYGPFLVEADTHCYADSSPTGAKHETGDYLGLLPTVYLQEPRHDERNRTQRAVLLKIARGADSSNGCCASLLISILAIVCPKADSA